LKRTYLDLFVQWSGSVPLRDAGQSWFKPPVWLDGWSRGSKVWRW